LARRKGVPVITFSITTLSAAFREFRRELEKVGVVAFYNSNGPADIKSKYGGIFFYGLHQVAQVTDLLGIQVDTAELRAHGKDGIATLIYGNGPVVTINCVNNGLWAFHATAIGDKGILDWTFANDANPYLAGTKLFTTMFRTGKEPIPHERMLAPIAVLEALSRSLKCRRPVKVASVSAEST
jgi:hypothetical protein